MHTRARKSAVVVDAKQAASAAAKALNRRQACLSRSHFIYNALLYFKYCKHPPYMPGDKCRVAKPHWECCFYFPTQRARRLIGRKGGRKQCALVKLLIYIPEWHKREGKALFHSHLSAGRRCTVRRDRMRPNNSELSEGFFFAALNLPSVNGAISTLARRSSRKVADIKVARRHQKRARLHV